MEKVKVQFLGRGGIDFTEEMSFQRLPKAVQESLRDRGRDLQRMGVTYNIFALTIC